MGTLPSEACHHSHCGAPVWLQEVKACCLHSKVLRLLNHLARFLKGREEGASLEASVPHMPELVPPLQGECHGGGGRFFSPGLAFGGVYTRNIISHFRLYCKGFRCKFRITLSIALSDKSDCLLV